MNAKKFYDLGWCKKLCEWYLPTFPLWTKVLVSSVVDDFDGREFQKSKVKNLSDGLNTSVYVEEFFRIKKVTTFRHAGKSLELDSFIAQNYKDNCGLYREAADGIVKELQQNKSIKKMGTVLKMSKQIIKPKNKENEELCSDFSSSDDDYHVKPAEEGWKDRKVKNQPVKKISYLSEGLHTNAFDPAKTEKKDNAPCEGKKKGNNRRKDLAKGAKKAKVEESDKTPTYKCCQCNLPSERKGMISCSECKKWYHACCFTPSLNFSFELSLLETNLLCCICITNKWRELGLFFRRYLKEGDADLERIFATYNHFVQGSETCIFEIINDELQEQHHLSIQVANRGFQNKLSNCWAASLVQMLFSTPLEEAIKDSKVELAEKLCSLFQDMKVVTKVPMSIFNLKSITDDVKIAMNNHQEIYQFYTNLIDHLIENEDNQVIKTKVKDLFAISYKTVKKCDLCGYVTGKAETETSIQVPIPYFKKGVDISLSSLLFSALTAQKSEEKLCYKCTKRSSYREMILVDKFPSILTVMLHRVHYDQVKKMPLINNSRVSFHEKINLSYCARDDVFGESVDYEPFGVICRRGITNDQGHFFAYILSEADKEKVIKFDDAKRTEGDAGVWRTETAQEECYIVAFRKVNTTNKGSDQQPEEWSIDTETKDRMNDIFNKLEDHDITNDLSIAALKTLRPNKWLRADVVDASFRLLSAMFPGVVALPHTVVVKKCKGGDVTSDVMRRWRPHTEHIIIPVLEKGHWFSAVISFKLQVIIILDSLYTTKKAHIFKILMSVASIVSANNNKSVKLSEWKFLQPSTLPRQEDGSNCGVIAFLNLCFLFNRSEVMAFPPLDFVREWMASRLIFQEHTDHVQMGKLDIKGSKELGTILPSDILVDIGDGPPYINLFAQIMDRNEARTGVKSESIEMTANMDNEGKGKGEAEDIDDNEMGRGDVEDNIDNIEDVSGDMVDMDATDKEKRNDEAKDIDKEMRKGEAKDIDDNEMRKGEVNDVNEEMNEVTDGVIDGFEIENDALTIKRESIMEYEEENVESNVKWIEKKEEDKIKEESGAEEESGRKLRRRSKVRKKFSSQWYTESPPMESDDDSFRLAALLSYKEGKSDDSDDDGYGKKVNTPP